MPLARATTENEPIVCGTVVLEDLEVVRGQVGDRPAACRGPRRPRGWRSSRPCRLHAARGRLARTLLRADERLAPDRDVTSGQSPLQPLVRHPSRSCRTEHLATRDPDQHRSHLRRPAVGDDDAQVVRARRAACRSAAGRPAGCGRRVGRVRAAAATRQELAVLQQFEHRRRLRPPPRDRSVKKNASSLAAPSAPARRDSDTAACRRPGTGCRRADRPRHRLAPADQHQAAHAQVVGARPSAARPSRTARSPFADGVVDDRLHRVHARRQLRLTVEEHLALLHRLDLLDRAVELVVLAQLAHDLVGLVPESHQHREVRMIRLLVLGRHEGDVRRPRPPTSTGTGRDGRARETSARRHEPGTRWAPASTSSIASAGASKVLTGFAPAPRTAK